MKIEIKELKKGDRFREVIGPGTFAELEALEDGCDDGEKQTCRARAIATGETIELLVTNRCPQYGPWLESIATIPEAQRVDDSLTLGRVPIATGLGNHPRLNIEYLVRSHELLRSIYYAKGPEERGRLFEKIAVQLDSR